jgi:ribose transport system ATP-binding protein
MSDALLELNHITKRFPGVLALDDVSMSVGRGEVVGLIGENGAGKSTLMKILGGVHQADAGEIRFDGKPVVIREVADALRLGIGFIHQELNVVDNLSAAANVFLGREPRRWGLIDRRKIAADSEPYLKRLSLDIPPKTPLRELSIAQQQLVEIAKALSQNARILIMDEPTSSLTLSETERLLTTVKDLREHGVSIIYISHRLGEIQQVADRVVALRDGKHAGHLDRAAIQHDNMVRLMVGRDIANFYVATRGEKTPGYFRARRIRSRSYPGKLVDFDATRGEILGFAGLVGAGRSELAEAIFGVDEGFGGEVFIGNEMVHIASCRDAIAHGIYLVPEDRRVTGLITSMTMRENVTLASVKQYARFGLIHPRDEASVAETQRGELGIKAPNVETVVATLSGGNQQKVVLGKWLSMQPRVIFFDEPTRGIDVGAKAEIYRLMRNLAERGVVVIMISSDMEEVLNVSDRIAVMHEGSITGVLTRDQFSEQAVMNLAVGKKAA